MGLDGFVLVVGSAAALADAAALLPFARALSPSPRGSAELQRTGQGWALVAIGDPPALPTLDQAPDRCIVASQPGRLATDDPASETPGWRAVIDASDPPGLQLIGDATGAAGLYWTELDGRLWISDRPEWLLGLPGLSHAEDGLYFAAYYAGLPAPWSRTPLAAIRSLPAAHRLCWRAGGLRLEAARLSPDPRVSGGSRTQLETRFRERLDQAVAAAMPDSAPAGVLLSGGFDSAAVLASLRSTLGPGPRIVAVTAGFRWPGIEDERVAAQPTARRFGVEHHQVDSAAHLPDLLGGSALRGPVGNPFRALSDAVYASLAATGVARCLTGQYADELDAGPMNFWQEWRTGWPGAGLPLLALLRQPVSVLRVLRQRLSGADRASGLRPDWQDALRCSRAEEQALFAGWPRPAQVAWALGSDAMASLSIERPHFRAHGLDARHPFRHWPLMRFLLSLPAVETRVLRSQKRLQKRAMAAVIPEAAARPAKIGSQLPLFLAAFRIHAPTIRAEVDAARLWEPYLQACPGAAAEQAGAAHALWRALAHVRWRRALERLPVASSSDVPRAGLADETRGDANPGPRR